MDKPQQMLPLSDLSGLRDWCISRDFDLEIVRADQIHIVDRELGSQWSLQRIEAWLQVKGWVLPDVACPQAMAATLAALHDRPLGCRFAVNDDNDLCILADLFPHDQSGAAVGAAITQMQSVVDSTEALFQRVQETGLAADERSIDEAFEQHAPTADH